jgi:hypothetical protein
MEKELIIIAASVVAVLIIYFIASPYKNCKRDYSESSMSKGRIETECQLLTSW